MVFTRCVTGLTDAAEKSNKDNKECNSIVTKYHRCVFSPSLSASVCLSAALMRFHENSETEQIGVVAPGVGTTKLNRMRMQYWKISVICVSAAEALQGNSRHMHMYKKINTAVHLCPHIHTHSNMIVHIRAGLCIVMMMMSLVCPQLTYPSLSDFKIRKE